MLYFTIQNRLQDGTSKVSEAAGARWRFSGRIVVGCVRIVFLLAEAFRELPLKIWSFQISWQAHSFWWGCRVTLLAPRIGNDVSYVTQISDDIHFAWQAQYLVMLDGDFTCSTHWKWRFICDEDQWWHSFCVAGAVFGAVRVGLFVAGAALRDILGDSRDAKCCILQYKIVSKMGRVRSPEAAGARWRFHARIISNYPRIVFLLAEALQGVSAQILNFKISWQAAVFGDVGGWLYLLHALEMTFHMWRRSVMTFIWRGRRSIWWTASRTFRGRRSTAWHFGR